MFGRFKKKPKTIPQLAYLSNSNTLKELDHYHREKVYTLFNSSYFRCPINIDIKRGLYNISHYNISHYNISCFNLKEMNDLGIIKRVSKK